MTTWYVILGVAAVVAVASRRARGGVAPEFEGPPVALAAPGVNVLDYIKAGSQYFYAPEGQAPRQITREQYEAAIAAAG